MQLCFQKVFPTWKARRYRRSVDLGQQRTLSAKFMKTYLLIIKINIYVTKKNVSGHVRIVYLSVCQPIKGGMHTLCLRTKASEHCIKIVREK